MVQSARRQGSEDTLKNIGEEKIEVDENGKKKLDNLKKWLGVSIDETDDEKKLNDYELKKASKKYAQDNFQGKKFKNKDSDREILVSRKGLDKWDNITRSREQSISIKKLNAILENMKKVGSESDRKNRKFVDGFTYFEHPINANRKPFTAEVATQETNGKNSKYYYHKLREQKNRPDPAFRLSQCDEESQRQSGSNTNIPQISLDVKGKNIDKE